MSRNKGYSEKCMSKLCTHTDKSITFAVVKRNKDNKTFKRLVDYVVNRYDLCTHFWFSNECFSSEQQCKNEFIVIKITKLRVDKKKRRA